MPTTSGPTLLDRCVLEILFSRLVNLIDDTIGRLQLLRLVSNIRKAGQSPRPETIREIAESLAKFGLGSAAQSVVEIHERLSQAWCWSVQVAHCGDPASTETLMRFVTLNTCIDEFLELLVPLMRELDSHRIGTGESSPSPVVLEQLDEQIIKVISRLSRGIKIEVLDPPSSRPTTWTLQNWIPTFLIELELGDADNVVGSVRVLKSAGYISVERTWFGFAPRSFEYNYKAPSGDCWYIKLAKYPITPEATSREIVQPVQFCRMTTLGLELTHSTPTRTEGDAHDVPADQLSADDPKDDSLIIDENTPLSEPELAKRFKVSPGALQGRLRTWRSKNKFNAHDLIETANPARNQPKFRYRYGAVKHIIEDLLAPTKRPTE